MVDWHAVRRMTDRMGYTPRPAAVLWLMHPSHFETAFGEAGASGRRALSVLPESDGQRPELLEVTVTDTVPAENEDGPCMWEAMLPNAGQAAAPFHWSPSRGRKDGA